MLQLSSLAVHGLAPVSFELAAGSCTALAGPSGSGKTVLMRAIADLDDARGDIQLAGVERRQMTGPIWRQRVRYAAAEPGWWHDTARPHFTTFDPGPLATMLGLDAPLLDRSLSDLSTGERQRFALIRAIADSPKVLLLDEPTGALDAAASRLVENLIRREAERGAAILFVSHDASQVKRLAEKVLTIRDGHVTEESP